MARSARTPVRSGARKAALTRSDRVRRRLADQIISGELKPGQHLDEKALAEAFKVSRTPVREALRQLAASELVDWRPHQSAVVASVTIPKMVEMLEVMAEVEAFCGRLAARRMTPDERKNLIELHKKCQPAVKAGDRAAYNQVNRLFHEAIYAGTHNGYLIDQAQSLYSRVAPYRTSQLDRPGRLQRAYRAAPGDRRCDRRRQRRCRVPVAVRPRNDRQRLACRTGGKPRHRKPGVAAQGAARRGGDADACPRQRRRFLNLTLRLADTAARSAPPPPHRPAY